MIDKILLKKHFNRNSLNYDRYASVQKEMALEIINELRPLAEKRTRELNILEIGCGTGYLTGQMERMFPDAAITALDIASGMLDIARGKTLGKNVAFICGDFEEIDIDGKFDIIISNATFQWFNRLDEALKKIDGLLKDEGIFCFSTLGHRTFTELHQSFQKARSTLGLSSASPPGPAFFTFDELLSLCRDSLAARGSRPLQIAGKESFIYELHDSVKSFLDSIKKIGANNCNQERSRNFSLTREMIKIYEGDYREKDGIKATYHCLFFAVER
jgi:malonyl-CoA O-methyltransferase